MTELESDLFGLKSLDFEKSWSSVKNVLECILSKSDKKISHQKWFESFSEIYKLSMSLQDPGSKRFYDATKEFFKQYTTSINKNLFEKMDGIDPAEFTSRYMREWVIYEDGARYINMLYHIFNKYFVHKNCLKNYTASPFVDNFTSNNFIEIKELMYTCWYEEIVTPYNEKIVANFMMQFKKMFETKSCDKELFLSLRSISLSISMKNLNEPAITDKFKNSILTPTLKYFDEIFENFAVELDSTKSITEYVSKVTDMFTRVTNLVQETFSPDNLYLNDFCNKLFEHTIIKKLDLFKQYFLDCFKVKGKKEGISKIYEIAKKCLPLRDILCDCVKTHVATVISQAFESLPVIKDFIATFESNLNEIKTLMARLFENEQIFQDCLKSSLTLVTNKINKEKEDSFAIMLSTHLDELLFMKKPSDQKSVITVLYIYSLFETKEVFDLNLKFLISHRVIHHTSFLQLEDTMFTLLKAQFSNETYLSLVKLFNDRKSADSTNKEYSKWLKSNGSVVIPSNVYVLKSFVWPFVEKQEEITIPEVINNVHTSFLEFYTNAHHGRKLLFLNKESHGRINYSVNGCYYNFLANLYQTVILIAFNTKTEYSFEDLKNVTNIPIDTIKQSIRPFELISLFIVDNSKIKLNNNFKYNKLSIELTEVEKQANVVLLNQRAPHQNKDDSHALQCLILRIIKAAHEINEIDLLAKIKDFNKYNLDINAKLIDNSLDGLKQREYITCSNLNGTKLYTYIPA